MDKDDITVSLRRDAALYLSMLLGDQILSIVDCNITGQLEEMRRAYEHARDNIERALKGARPPPVSAPRANGIGRGLETGAAD